jgi:pyruvate carboxylase subunit B
MVKKKKKTISFMCTAFRDGFQSCFGSRVLSKDYLPVVAEAVKAGFKNIESGGGASFQSAFFYNNENAFDVMDKFREICGDDVNLQTLARGVNVVALDSQSSEMIKLHAELFKKHGVSTIRNFDALNDNIENAPKFCTQCGQRFDFEIT